MVDEAAIPSGGGPLAYVTDLAAPTLSDEDHHHLARVRRVRDGDELIVGDGRGSWRRARMAGASPEPVGPVVAAPRPRPEVAIGFALTKGAKPELAVQKLTELGVDRIVPFVADRSIVRWDATKGAAAHERLAKVARAAAMQSRQGWLPELEAVATFAELVGRPGAVLADRGGEALSSDHRLVLVGPEGGWSAVESAAPVPKVAIADGVLRAETAAIVAGALLVAVRAGTVAPPP